MDFSLLVKRLMNRKGLTEYGIAKLCGVSAPTINRLLNGKYLPKLETIEKLCESTGTSLSEFFANDEQIVIKTPSDAHIEGYVAALISPGAELTAQQAKAYAQAAEDQAERRRRFHQELDNLLDEYENKTRG